MAEHLLSRLFSWQLITLVLIACGAAMSLEFSASRLLTPVFGSTIYTWGSLIGVILAGLSLGYYLGGKLADKKPSIPDNKQAPIKSGTAQAVIISINVL